MTGAEKIVVSICAIGQKVSDVDVSRKFAKIGDVVFTTGVHGDSAGGLKQLFEEYKDTNLIKAHLNPIAQLEKSFELLKILELENIEKVALMDTSDGLVDAMYRISKDSSVAIECDFLNVPVSNDLKKEFPTEFQNLVLWGGKR